MGGGLAAGTEILRFAGRGNEARAKRLFYEYNALRFVSAAFFWALFFFGAPAIVTYYHYEPDLIGSIRIMSFMFFAGFFLSVVTTVVSMRLDFKALSSRRTMGKSFQLALLIGFFLFSAVGFKEVLLSFVIGHFLSTAILLPAAVRAWKPWRGLMAERGSLILWRVARANGKWDSVKNLVSLLGSRVQPWLINFFVSTEAVGIYGVATSLAEVVMQAVPRNTMDMLIMKVFHDKTRSQKVFTYAVKYSVLWSGVLAVGAILAVPFAIQIFLPQYIPSLQFFYFLVAAVPLKSFQWMTDLFLRAFRQQKFAFMRGVTRSMFMPVLLLVSLPVIGLWAVPLTEVLVRISVAYMGYRHLLKIRPEFRISPQFFFSFGAQDWKIFKDIAVNMKLFLRRPSVY